MVWYLFFTDIPKRKWPLFRRQIWTWKVSPRPPCLKVLIKRNNFLKLVYPVLFRGFQLFPVFASGFWSVNGFTVFSCGFPLLCFSVVSHSLPVNMKCYPVFKNIPKFYRTRTLISIPIQIPILIRFNTSFDADFISILTPISYRFRTDTDTDFNTDTEVFGAKKYRYRTELKIPYRFITKCNKCYLGRLQPPRSGFLKLHAARGQQMPGKP